MMVDGPVSHIALQRRFDMIVAFLTCTKVNVAPILTRLGMFRRYAVNDDGTLADEASASLRGTLKRLTADEYFSLAGPLAVGNTNLGYAFEHMFKLCIRLETGKETPYKGQKGHNLAALYGDLGVDTKDALERAKQSQNGFVDCELAESFNDGSSDRGAKLRDAKERGPRTLENELRRLHNHGLLIGSRYKYQSARRAGTILVPFGLIRLLDAFLKDYLAPRLNRAYEPVPFDNTDELATSHKPTIEWDGKAVSTMFPNASLGVPTGVTWQPQVFVGRIRRRGETQWGPGVLSPFADFAVRAGTDSAGEYELGISAMLDENNESEIETRPFSVERPES